MKGRRVDPVTHLVYNLESDVIPEEILGRLVRRFGDEEDLFRQRLGRYRSRLESIAQHYSRLGVRVSSVDGRGSVQDTHLHILKML